MSYKLTFAPPGVHLVCCGCTYIFSLWITPKFFSPPWEGVQAHLLHPLATPMIHSESNVNTLGQCEADILIIQPIVTSRFSWREQFCIAYFPELGERSKWNSRRRWDNRWHPYAPSFRKRELFKVDFSTWVENRSQISHFFTRCKT